MSWYSVIIHPPSNNERRKDDPERWPPITDGTRHADERKHYEEAHLELDEKIYTSSSQLIAQLIEWKWGKSKAGSANATEIG